MTAYFCPICSASIAHIPRYPAYVCSNCVSRAADKSGRKVEFFNTDMSGGIAGQYRDSGEQYNSCECIIDGVECIAAEARFGGIVIEKVAKTPDGD